MFPYWTLIGIFALGTLVAAPSAAGSAPGRKPMLIVGMILIALLVGLRNQVGADWVAYVRIFRFTGLIDWEHAIATGDPGFMLLNWCVQQIGGPISWVNLVGAVIFTVGLYRLARVQPEPWAAVLVAMPYLVIVVAMNFARQGIAMGFVMAGLASLATRGSVVRFILFMIGAALFHRTSIVIMPIALFGMAQGRLFTSVVSITGVMLLYISMLKNNVDGLVQNYLGAAYKAEGAFIRVGMNIIPTIMFTFFNKKLNLNRREYVLCRNLSIASTAALVALFIVPSSASIDRVSIYILPLQIIILSRLPLLTATVMFGRITVVLYSIAVFFVWLTYSFNSYAWIPYRSFM